MALTAVPRISSLLSNPVVLAAGLSVRPLQICSDWVLMLLECMLEMASISIPFITL